MKRLLFIVVLFLFLPISIEAQLITQDGIGYSVFTKSKVLPSGKILRDKELFVCQVPTSLEGEVKIPSKIVSNGFTYPVTSVEKGAFEDCSQITSIVLPNGIRRIEWNAFRNCTALRRIIIPGSVEYIGESAFYNCYNLLYINLPSSISSISRNAFEKCEKLVYVTIPANIKYIYEPVFIGCRNLKDIYCHSTTVVKISAMTFSGFQKEKVRVHVPQNVIEAYKSTLVWRDFPHFDSNMTKPNIDVSAPQKSLSTSSKAQTTIEAVDMGGSVLWANMNIGASNPKELGELYAWGETKTKETFTRGDYKRPTPESLSLYPADFYTPGIGIKATKFDVARMKWGNGWRLPTREEVRELITCCSFVLHKKDHLIEVVAKNGNRLYFPYLTNINSTYNGISNIYWTSDVEDYDKPICIRYSEGGWEIGIYSPGERRTVYFQTEISHIGGYIGGLIRPVRKRGNFNAVGANKTDNRKNNSLTTEAVLTLESNKENKVTKVNSNPSCYFVFGTRKELSEQKIVTGDTVNINSSNKLHFTKANKYIDKEIKLFSRTAEILTSHPTGSYELIKDDNGYCKLRIDDPDKFWSTSIYLVVVVK